jgi:hypothetical protein
MRTHPNAIGAVAVIAAAVLATSVDASPPTLVRRCGSDVHGDLGPASRWQRRSVLVGPFALVWIRDAAHVPASRIRSAYEQGHGAFKVLALVKLGHEATVAVPAFERRHVALLYDRSKFAARQTVANGEPVVTFRACRSSGQGTASWSAATQFNGGIVVDRPLCVTLDVRIRGSATRRIRAAFARGAC